VKQFLRLPQLDKIREAVRSRTEALRHAAPRSSRREVVIIALVAVVSAIVTLIVLTVSFNAREHRALDETRGLPGRGAVARPKDEVSIDDFLLPQAPPADKPVEYYPFRPRLPRWSKENVEKFWVSPRRIATDTIAVLNDRNMESMFEKVK